MRIATGLIQEAQITGAWTHDPHKPRQIARTRVASAVRLPEDPASAIQHLATHARENRVRLQSLIPYRCDIFVDHDGGSVSIWRKDSGLHPAGLDFLMTRSKEWYAQRKHQRSLKPGDRIAVGRGIAVVEHADAHQVHALWKRGKLRLLRKDIAWDDVNSRWELNGSA